MGPRVAPTRARRAAAAMAGPAAKPRRPEGLRLRAVAVGLATRREGRLGLVALAVCAALAALGAAGGGGGLLVLVRAAPGAAGLVALCHLLQGWLEPPPGKAKAGGLAGGAWGRSPPAAAGGLGRDALRENPHAWKQHVRAPELERAWERLNGGIIQWFIYELWWQNLSPDRELAGEVRRILNGAFVSLATRGRKVDLNVLINDAVQLIIEQLELFRFTRDEIGRVKFNQMPYFERNLALKARMMADLTLHPAAKGPEYEYKALRKLFDGIVPLLLENEVRRIPLQDMISRELLVCCVIRPVVGLFSTARMKQWMLAGLNAGQKRKEETGGGEAVAAEAPQLGADNIFVRMEKSLALEVVQSHQRFPDGAAEHSGASSGLFSQDSMDVPVQTLEEITGSRGKSRLSMVSSPVKEGRASGFWRESLGQGTREASFTGSSTFSGPEGGSPERGNGLTPSGGSGARSPLQSVRPAADSELSDLSTLDSLSVQSRESSFSELSAASEAPDVKVVQARQIVSGRSGKYIAYAISITVENESTKKLYRRFRNFNLLHKSLKKELPSFSYSMPPKRSFKLKLDTEFVESRRRMLDRYLRKLANDAEVRNSFEFQDFLSEASAKYSTEAGGNVLVSVGESVGNALGEASKAPVKAGKTLKKAAKKIKTAVKLAAGGKREGARAGVEERHRRELSGDFSHIYDQIFESQMGRKPSETDLIALGAEKAGPYADAEGRPAADESEDDAERDEFHVIAPVLNLCDTIFQLDAKGFFRRQVHAITRLVIEMFAGPSLDDLLNAQLEQLKSPHTLGKLLDLLTDFLWPGGEYPEAPYPPPRPEDCDPPWWKQGPEADATGPEISEQIHKMLMKDPPAALTALLGKAQCRQGLQDVFDMLHSEVFIKQIGFGLVEMLLAAEFPEIVGIVMEVHGGYL